MEINGIIKFIEFLHKFQNIERVLWLKGRDYPENDVEHSYQLAMVGWYIASTYKLNLNVDKVVKYALIHDLVETYAGDVDAFDPDPNRDEKKAKKEKESLEQIKVEFSEFPEITDGIEQYEMQNDEESRFVYALDKVIPVVNIYLDGGRTWRNRGITFTLEKLVINKKLKVVAHPQVEKYFDQLVSILEKEQHLFAQE